MNFYNRQQQTKISIVFLYPFTILQNFALIIVQSKVKLTCISINLYMKTNISKLKSSITNSSKLNFNGSSSNLTNPQINKTSTTNSGTFQGQQFSSNYQTIFKTVFDEKLNPDKKIMKNYSSQQNQQVHKVGPIKFGRKNHSNSKLIVDETPLYNNNYENILNKQKQWKNKKSFSFSKNEKDSQYFTTPIPDKIQKTQKIQSQIILEWSRNKEELKNIQLSFQAYKEKSYQTIGRLNRQNEELTNQLKKQKEQSIKKIVQLQLQLASTPQQILPPVIIQRPTNYKELGESFQKKVNELYDQTYQLKNKISSLQGHISELQIKNSSLLLTIAAYQQKQSFQTQNCSVCQSQAELLRRQNEKLKDERNMILSQHEMQIMKLENKIQGLKVNLQEYKSQNSQEKLLNNVSVEGSYSYSHSIKMQQIRFLAKEQFAEIIKLKKQRNSLKQKLNSK